MKKIINQLLFITVVATSITHSTHAYRWIMTNWSNKTILVQLELLASSAPFYVFVLPRKSADFNWPLGNGRAGFCLGKIKYIVLPERGQESGTDKATLRLFVDQHVDKHGLVQDANIKSLSMLIDRSAKYDLRTTAELRFLTDKLYNQVIDQAKRIGGSAVVGWFADQIAHSKCRSRDIDIVEDENGQMQFYTLAN
jgi:hypothetical protein